MTARAAVELLRGAIDTHVHSYPDVRPRRHDDIELVERARAAGMRAVLIKSHLFPTGERAYLLNRIFPDFRVFGGIALNDTVGGFNAGAVDVALRMGAVMVWMPTNSAANHARHLGGAGRLGVSDDGRRLRAEVVAVLERVAEHDAILGTGHLSPDESALVVREAWAIGVRRVVATHPEWGVTAISVEQQRRWAGTGHVWFERCLVSTEPTLPMAVPFATVVEQIHAVGCETTVLATDYGLKSLPAPVDGLAYYAAALLEAGVAEADVRLMLQDNPARLLHLDEPPAHTVREPTVAAGTTSTGAAVGRR